MLKLPIKCQINPKAHSTMKTSKTQNPNKCNSCILSSTLKVNKVKESSLIFEKTKLGPRSVLKDRKFMLSWQ